MIENSMTFEEKMLRLEQIVRALEKGEVPLEESLLYFQEGTQLVQSCQKQLEEAQLQVKMITVNGDGEPVEEAFGDDSE